MTMRSLFLTAALLLVAGCSNVPAPYQGTDYSASAPIRLNVGTILVDSAYTAPAMEPNIDHQMVPQPQDMLRTAITQHYSAMRANMPGAATLRFEIKDASVIERALPQPEGFFNRMSSKNAQYHYDGRLEINAAASGPGTRRTGFIHAEATRSLEVAHLSPAERQRQVQGMVSQMVDDIMGQIDKQMNDNMSTFSYSTGASDITVTPQPSGRWDHVMNPPQPQRAGL